MRAGRAHGTSDPVVPFERRSSSAVREFALQESVCIFKIWVGFCVLEYATCMSQTFQGASKASALVTRCLAGPARGLRTARGRRRARLRAVHAPDDALGQSRSFGSLDGFVVSTNIVPLTVLNEFRVNKAVTEYQ